MKFVVAIGNPEKKYDGTRHNVGFGVLDDLKKSLEKERREKLRRSLKFSAECFFASDDVLLIKPETYVNRTGDSVSMILREYPSPPSDFLFVCDDVNLRFGKLRLRGSGSAGGHHGLESVIGSFGSEDFGRLRVGVGTETMPKDDLTEFVLGKFAPEEKKSLGAVLERAAEVCRVWIEKGLGPASDRLSRLQSV